MTTTEKTNIKKFREKYREELEIDEIGNLNIKDMHLDGGCYIVYRNGKFFMSALF